MNQGLPSAQKASFCHKLWSLTTLLCVVLMNVSVSADEMVEKPHQQVKETTEKVLALLQTGIDPVASPDEFVKQVSAVLDPVVAFELIAKRVMGVYADRASSAQIKNFAMSFKKGLVNTYAQGVSGLSDITIRTLPAKGPVGNKRRVGVIQEIQGAAGTTKIFYDMAKNSQGQWKMINLIINGINFGQVFRSQFAAAVEKNSGDLDKTIQEWAKGV